jgi:hypothetical protein
MYIQIFYSYVYCLRLSCCINIWIVVSITYAFWLGLCVLRGRYRQDYEIFFHVVMLSKHRHHHHHHHHITCSLVFSEVGIQTISFNSPDFNFIPTLSTAKKAVDPRNIKKRNIYINIYLHIHTKNKYMYMFIFLYT